MKTNEEIENIKKACKITLACFDYIKEIIKPGMTELEIAKLMNDFMFEKGADGLAFDTIVGSGVNSSFIHSTPTDRKILENDIILLDFGCTYNGYCSDVSRTIFVGEPKEEWINIYNIVKRAYETAVSNIKAGITCKEADSIARDVIKSSGYDFAHALGHGVGKVVHDEPVISSKNENVLEDGTVFTIEPGIYIEGEFGVRIENTVMLKDGSVEEFI